MHPVELASNIVCNTLQHIFVDFRRYGFSVSGSPRCKATGYCLAVISKRYLERNPGAYPCIPVLRQRPDLLLSAVRVIPRNSATILAVIKLAVAMIRDNPTRFTMRAAFVSLVYLFVSMGDLSHCFGYLNHPRHGWPEPIYNCLEQE